MSRSVNIFLDIRRYEERDLDAAVALWRATGPVRPGGRYRARLQIG